MSLERPYVDFADGQSVAISVVRSLSVVAGGFLVLIVLQTLVLSLTGIESTETLRGMPVVWALVSGLPGASFVVAALAYMRVREERSLFAVGAPTPRDGLWIVAGFVALAVLNQVMSVVLAVLSSLLDSLFDITVTVGQNSVVELVQANPEVAFYLLPVTVLFVAPGEELLFRGVVQGLLRRSLGVVPGIVGAALIFGGIHVVSISSGDAWTYVLVATALGLVLGTIYEYTENLLVPIAVHALWNCSLFLYIYLQVTGGAPSV
jgi:membrane protease YdiL (CAAX protease family)